MITFAGNHYFFSHFVVDDHDPRARVGALVGIADVPDDPDVLWARVARSIGASPAPAREIAERARDRGDLELAEAIGVAARLARGGTAWPSDWDLVLPLHPDARYLAVVLRGRCRVAVGVADPRDHLPAESLVTDGGLVWVEVETPEQTRDLRANLTPDVLAPVQSERWVRWMRLEHQARLASLAGAQWQLRVDTVGWCATDGASMRDLLEALEWVASRPAADRVSAAQHLRHTVPRSVMAVDRAAVAARRDSLQAIESDPVVGFTAVRPSGRQRGSSVLGVLLPDPVVAPTPAETPDSPPR